MHRRPLLNMLECYRQRFLEGAVVDRIVALVERMPIASSGRAGQDTSLVPPGSCRPIGGGVCSRTIASSTAGCSSAVMPTARRQFEEVALREAREESGMSEFDLVPIAGAMLPLDLDVHLIPARYDAAGRQIEDAHEHHDVRFLLVAHAGQVVTTSDESHEVRWFTRKKCCGSPTKRACYACSIRRRSSSIKSKGPIARNSPADRLPGGQFFCE